MMTLDHYRRRYQLQTMTCRSPEQQKELDELLALEQFIQKERDASWQRRVAEGKLTGKSPICLSSE